MTIAVLGGGLQGCCTALALADRGQPVIMFDRQPDILTRTAVANEGRVLSAGRMRPIRRSPLPGS